VARGGAQRAPERVSIGEAQAWPPDVAPCSATPRRTPPRRRRRPPRGTSRVRTAPVPGASPSLGADPRLSCGLRRAARELGAHRIGRGQQWEHVDRPDARAGQRPAFQRALSQGEGIPACARGGRGLRRHQAGRSRPREIDFLTDELARTVGLGGRARRLGWRRRAGTYRPAETLKNVVRRIEDEPARPRPPSRANPKPHRAFCGYLARRRAERPLSTRTFASAQRARRAICQRSASPGFAGARERSTRLCRHTGW